MTLLLMALAVVIVLTSAFAAQRLAGRTKQRSKSNPYIKRDHLFSPAERLFLQTLQEAVSDHFRVFGKVRVADVIDVTASIRHGARRAALNRITSKHFDYVLCRKDDMSVVCAIELDDRSHAAVERQRRDAFLDQICSDILLPLIRIEARASYSIPTVRTQVLGPLGVSPPQHASLTWSRRVEPVMTR